MRAAALILLVLVPRLGWPQATSGRTHRLEASPATVAYGYYWSEVKRILRIASDDILDVDTLLTSTPERLEEADIAGNLAITQLVDGTMGVHLKMPKAVFK